jgi:hypothetical protein
MAGCCEFESEGWVPRIAGSVPFFVGSGSAGVEPRMDTDGLGSGVGRRKGVA